MRPRISAARFLISFGEFIKSLAVVVMKPADLVEFGRRSYASPGSIAAFSLEELVNSGLSGDEKELLDKIPLKTGRALILGVGSGREAISLARMGFEVTGVDFVPELAEMARAGALKQGIHIEVLVGEISRIDFPDRTFDLVWLSTGMYSAIPGRKRRVEMLKKIKDILKTGGHFLLQYHCTGRGKGSTAKHFARKLFAVLSLGNFHYEPGDMLWANREFIHGFFSEAQIRSELKASGLKTAYLDNPNGKIRGGALLVKQ